MNDPYCGNWRGRAISQFHVYFLLARTYADGLFHKLRAPATLSLTQKSEGSARNTGGNAL